MHKDTRFFPVLEERRDGHKTYVKRALLSEEWAVKLYKQTLDTLASKGGMSWEEIYWNYYQLPINMSLDVNMLSSMMDILKC